MPRLTHSVPKYSHHRASGQAVVTIVGRDIYLGPYKSKASVVEYDRIISGWLARGRRGTESEYAGTTVAELLAAYWKYAQGYYRKNGKPTKTVESIRLFFYTWRTSFDLHFLRNASV